MEQKNCLLSRLNVKAFTLIELLVVVLIIGILAAVALPQYQKAVEKSRMAEAVIITKKIAEAQQRFFLANGRYATFEEMDVLDIDIPHTRTVTVGGQRRLLTRDFYYTCQGGEAGEIAVGRLNQTADYWFTVQASSPNVVRCGYNSARVTALRKKLCDEYNQKGTL